MPNEITDAKPPESVRKLIETYDMLIWDARGCLTGQGVYVFVKVPHDNDFAPPATLPSITLADNIYFPIPADIDLPADWSKRASPYLAEDATHEGVAFIPERAADWLDGNKIDDATIIEAIEKHCAAVRDADQNREAKELLARERRPSAGLYASAASIYQ